MRHASRSSRPRHLAGAPRQAWEPPELPAEFDVAAALDPDTGFDFEALFAGEDPLQPEPKARVKAARHRVAFAVSITLAAVPLLVLDNLGARADSPSTVATDLPDVATSEVAPIVVDVTVAKATVFVSNPTSTTAAADAAASSAAAAAADDDAEPGAELEAEPAPTTITTAKPAPTTTTTAKPAPTTTTTPAPSAVAPAPTGPDPASQSTWEQLAQCETGGDWTKVSTPRQGQVYYGGLQFSLATWEGLGGTGLPSDAPKSTQIAMGQKLQARSGWGAWPGCARKLGWS